VLEELLELELLELFCSAQPVMPITKKTRSSVFRKFISRSYQRKNSKNSFLNRF
jgi:hypothetical protein